MFDTGNAACAMAVKATRPDLIAAYPITPQSTVAEKLAAYIAGGELQAKFLPVESEHSALSAVAAASTVGARVFTATSSQGLLYMHEIMHYAAGGRLPIVMANINRAPNAPWCLYVDHQDSVSQRDTGWIQMYAADNQEIHDFIYLSYRMAESLSIPVMLCYDGFLLSHSMAPFKLVDDEMVKNYLPPFKPIWQLHPDVSKQTYSNVTPANLYSDYREKLATDIMKAVGAFENYGTELDDLTGHDICKLFSAYKTEDADTFIMSMGSMGMEAELAVDILREQGIKAGSLRLKLFRPFPEEAFRALLPKEATLITLDRNNAYGTGGGALYSDAKSSLYGQDKKIKVFGRTMGIGGKDITAQSIYETIREILSEAEVSK